MDKETPRDKLLEAFSEPKATVPSRQEEIDKTCRRLDAYAGANCRYSWRKSSRTWPATR